MKGKRVFITGATGFVGSHLAEKLVADNDLRLLVRPGSAGKLSNRVVSKARLINGDLVSPECYRGELQTTDIVIHAASHIDISATRETLAATNIRGSESLASACVGAPIERFVYISTSVIAERDESTEIALKRYSQTRFRNNYEWSKYNAEHALQRYAVRGTLPLTIVRPHVIYGSGRSFQSNISPMYNALSALCRLRVPLILGSGRNRLQFVHVEDVADAIIHLAVRPEAGGRIHAVAGPTTYTLRELVQAIASMTSKSHSPLRVPLVLVQMLLQLKWLRRRLGLSPELCQYLTHDLLCDGQQLLSTGFQYRHTDFLRELHCSIECCREAR